MVNLDRAINTRFIATLNSKMSSIPFKALQMGALNLFSEKVAYGKSRVSGSKNVSYIMCSKSGVMPGQKNLFTSNHLTKPYLGAPVSANTYLRSFRVNQCNYLKNIQERYYCLKLDDEFTYDEYYPYDDEVYKITILASYRQIYGNLHAMESEKSIDLERRLRNGDITVKEFIRGLSKSVFYKKHYLDKVNQQRALELSYKHILGRPPIDQKEIIQSIEKMNQYGFDYYIDSLIDSKEYDDFFGDYIVPFQRCWNSPNGTKTSSFLNTARLTKGFAISDNSLNREAIELNHGGSILLKNLASSSFKKQKKSIQN